MHAARAGRGDAESAASAALADVIAQPMPGPIGTLMRERLRAVASHEVDNPPALPPTQAPRTPWNRPITPHRRFAYTTIPLEDAKRVRRAVRLHVQRRRDGVVLGHAAPLSRRSTTACRTSR